MKYRCTSALVLLLSCGMIATGQTWSERDIDKPIVLVSNTKITDTQFALVSESQLSILESRAGAHGFEVVVAEKAIWLIPDGFFGTGIKTEFAKVCAALRESVNQNGASLQKSQLDPSARQLLDRQLAIIAKSVGGGLSEIVVRDDMTFGLDVMQAIVLSDGNRKVTLRETEDVGLSITENGWNKTAIQSSGESDALSILDERIRDVELPKPNFLDELHFRISQLPVIRPRVRALRLKELMDHVSSTLVEVDSAARSAEESLTDLLASRGRTGFNDSIAKGTNFRDIDPKLRSFFESRLLANPSAYGFEGDADVTAFLSSAKIQGYGRDLQIVIPREYPGGERSILSVPFGSQIGH